MIVENERELGEAIERKVATIVVRGKMAPRIKKIWLMDRFLWCLCLACLAVAMAALVTVPAASATPFIVSLVSGTPAALFVGTQTVVTVVLIAAAGNGIATLRKLRHCYNMEWLNSECVLCYRKNMKSYRMTGNKKDYRTQ